MITVNQKKQIEEAIANALRAFEVEYKNVFHRSEESLRYLVATEISKLGVFGTLPNTSRKTPQLLFQYSYQKFKTRDLVWKPDIISAKFNNNGDMVKPYFAIELKVNSSDKDFPKCQNYVSQKFGIYAFDLSILININSLKKFELPKYQKIEKNIKTGSILWCSLDISRKKGSQGSINTRWY